MSLAPHRDPAESLLMSATLPRAVNSVLEGPAYSFPQTTRWKAWEAGRDRLFRQLVGHFCYCPARFLEIGAFEGASGLGAKVTTHWIDSQDVRKYVPDNHFDFVYVDGSHAAPNVLFDVVNAHLICRPGGLIGCDDYLFAQPEDGSVPKPAIDAFLALMGDRIEVVHSGYQLWFRKQG